MFWILVGMFVALAMGLLSYYLWRKPSPLPAGQAVDAINVLRDQRAELDAEVAAGRMTDAERETRISELARRVHDEGLTAGDEAAVAMPAGAPARRPWMAVGVALLVPAIAIPVYLHVGNPAALDPAARIANAAPHGEFSPEQMKVLLDKVRAKLKDNPNDVNGWVMLARGSQVANDFAAAADAFARANALKPDDAELLADYADSLAMAQNRTLAGKPWALIQQALRINPKLPKALALAASAEMEQRRFASAKGYWQQLLALVPPESEDATDIKSTIAQLSALPDGVAPTAAAAMAAAPIASAAAATAAQASPAIPAPAVPGKMITGTVTLAPALAAKVAPADVLYIFARGEGSRMPVAILRLKASELPKQYQLDDTSSMMGDRALSSMAQVRVEARISKTGDASPKAGDMRGESALIAPGARNADIVIGEVIATTPPPPAGMPGAAPAAGPRSALPAPAVVAPAAPSTPATATTATTPSTAGKAISGTVKLAPALASKMAPGDTLFIFARAAEGSRMPLAIMRLKAEDLPKQFRLDDTLGMAGGPALSSVAQVRIEARVSKSGEALPKPGDLRGESAVVAPGAGNIEVVIDRVVP